MRKQKVLFLYTQTLIVDSTLRSDLHRRQVSRGSGFSGAA
jgi:hypothetical protein